MDLHRGPDAQAALEAAAIVIGNVISDHTDQLLPGGESPAIVTLPLEDAPEAFHGAVVNALAHPGHALGDAGRGQLVMEDLGGIGAAPVTVKQRMDAGIVFQRPVQSAVDQGGVVGVPDGKGDDSVGIPVDHSAQIR